ncbi:hypothetical protein NDU88_012040 [Pleurodeles waltl]|uniref:KRAB domain-containing protein n=1 Tax=Pleurodeles waltl TaxID=8319 RepID=A0AAV7S823_PLEWA|nr:hypothetical protein NDU88_012040 [Pleurodeles waltl]
MTDAFSDQVRVKFHDVAIYFSEEEWERLEKFEKKIYKSVIEKIHATIISLGCTIVNKQRLFRIEPDLVPRAKKHLGPRERDPTTGSPIPVPDILLRVEDVKIAEEEILRSQQPAVSISPCAVTSDPTLPLRIKEEESPFPIDLPDKKEVTSKPAKGVPSASPDLIVVVKSEEDLSNKSLQSLQEGPGSALVTKRLNHSQSGNGSKSLAQSSAPDCTSTQEKPKQRRRPLASASSMNERAPGFPHRRTGFKTSSPAMKRRRLERPIQPKKEEAPAVLDSQEFPEHVQRHAEIRADDIDILEIERNEKKTRQQTNWAVNVFKSWLKEQFKPEEFENLSKSDLAMILREFYATVRTSDSQHYSVSSYVCMRAGINRYINDPPYRRNFNIMRDSEFNSANNVFLATLKKLKKEGKDATDSHPAISPVDMQKLKKSKVLNTNTPDGLIRTVWFNIQIHFARRGRKGQRELPANAFKILTDPQGFKYATLAFDEKTKSLSDPREYRGIMYASGHKGQCPVAALEKYLSKLPPNPSCFYLKAKRIPASLLESTPVWYENRPLGKNTLGGMMSALSREANLSRNYTNHSIRATSIQILSDAGLETREIMTLTGHKKDLSVRAYWAPTEAQRKTWSHLLTLAGTTAENSGNSDTPSTSGGAGSQLQLASFVHCRILGAV